MKPQPKFSLEVALKVYHETLAAEGETAASDFLQWVTAKFKIADDGIYERSEDRDSYHRAA